MIYLTPYATGLSVDSGFTSLDEVRETMGEPNDTPTRRLLVYGEDDERVGFSDFAFRVEVK